MSRFLIATEELPLQNLLKDALGSKHELEFLPYKENILKKLNSAVYELIFIDMQLTNGMELLESIKSIAPTVPVIAMGSNRAELVVEVIKKGAYDFLVKPIPSEKVEHSVEKALQNKSFKGEIDYLRRQQDVIYDIDSIIAKSPRMKMAVRMIKKICKIDSTISMTGETGTGKSFFAGTIHFNSHRKKRPFVTINCANLPESLLESELFGHEKGTFTGATRTRIGRFEQANGGTVFLDEIGDLGPALQSKLLRFVEERTFERLGGNKTMQSDVRIIVATNKSLEEEISKGKFREDLYYRVNVINIHLPSFRERVEDIEDLSYYFLKKHCRNIKRDIEGFDPEVLEMFKRYQWPGNLRELSNVIERAVLLSEDTMIRMDNILLAREVSSFERDVVKESSRQSLSDIERESIIDALDKCLWIQKDAAEKLGISKRALNYKIKRLGIKHVRWRKNK
jgi:DNA-binding NtrC family response regulator